MRQLFEGKPCTVCGSTKRRKPKGNRKTGACHACTTKKEKEYYELNKDKFAIRNSKWFKENPESVKEYTKKEFKKNPEKVRARKRVYYAIKKNSLEPVHKRLCKDCGSQAQHYHHEDYSKPLDVIPLCNLCHVKRHL